MIRTVINSSAMAAVYILFSSSIILAGTFTIEPGNSSVIFKIKNNNGYTIGFFESFSGVLKLSEDNAKVLEADGKFDVRSINTHNVIRDAALRSDLFFDTEKFPEASFTSTKVEGDTLTGNLTIKGKTNPVALTMVLNGTLLTLRGKINRNDFGISFNEKLPQGKMLLGDEVQITAEIEAVVPAAANQ